MNIKKKLTTMSLSALALGAIAVTNVEEADAAVLWAPRSVTDVREDVTNVSEGEVEYTIQWGDTLGIIAKAVDIPVETLVEINGINNADLIVVGNTIRFSADKETVTVEDQVRHEEKTYDVSQDQAEEVATEPIEEVEVVEEIPAEFEAQATAEAEAAEQAELEAQAAEQAELEAQAAEQAELEAQAAEAQAAEQAELEAQAATEAQAAEEAPATPSYNEPALVEEPAVPENNEPVVRTVASQTATTQTVSTQSMSTTTSSESGSVVGIANKYLGTPYLWAGTTPSGFDCSGFTQFVFAQAGKSIPRNTNSQYAQATPVSNPQAGDLVFFGTPGNVQHVGIYTGGGEFVGAQSSTGVAYTEVFGPYWGQRFLGYGRI